MGDTAANLFDLDRGQALPAFSGLALLESFTGAHNDDRPAVTANNINASAASTAEDAERSEGSHDALINDPYAMTVRKLFYEKLKGGKWGEAIDMLAERLENADEDYARELLLEFRDEFEDMGLQDAANQLTAILSFSDLSAGFDFFADSGDDISSHLKIKALHPRDQEPFTAKISRQSLPPGGFRSI